jgi:Domain of unknown function (DUF4160)
VRYGSQRAIVDIGTLAVPEGSLSPRVLGLAVEWAAQHQHELRAIGTGRERDDTGKYDLFLQRYA